MRGLPPESLLDVPPPGLRMTSKATQAYLDLRRKILTGIHQAGEVLTPKGIEEMYHVTNNGTQMVLFRLAIEGLVKVFPVRERSWPNNAAINEYQVADLNVSHRIISSRRCFEKNDALSENTALTAEFLALKIQYADAEIAHFLQVNTGDNIIWSRTRERNRQGMIVSLRDLYLPFWFASMIPEFERGVRTAEQLLFDLGRQPNFCRETVHVAQAQSDERVIMELSPDDPIGVLKILRRSFDIQKQPVLVEFLTLRGDIYRLEYSFS